MRVMMIGVFPPSPYRIDGGVAAAMTYLCQALNTNKNVDLVGVRICAAGWCGAEQAPFEWPIVDAPLSRLAFSTCFWRERQQLRKLIHRFQPDIVHAQGVDPEGWIALSCGVPSVVTVHGLLWEQARLEPKSLQRVRGALKAALLERLTVRASREIIAISPYVTEYYGKSIGGRVHQIPNATAPDYFRVRRAPERGRILFAGRVIHRKGVADLVQAVSKCSEAVSKLVLAGSTPDSDFLSHLRERIRMLGLESRCEFAGHMDESSLLQEFARAETLVLPSYQETAPMVIQQAMAAGLAVVASRVGGVPYQVEHDVSGLLFESGNTQQLAHQLRRLHMEPSLGERLGAAAREHAAASFSADMVADATYKAYRVILDEHRQE
ncbi:MAG: glycosyltransferase family 1 protein [Gammaproteobacteria bacterium]|nr:MAG: glycosyltransferase family 1 protein [Gammaproteobacteria bacterium]